MPLLIAMAAVLLILAIWLFRARSQSPRNQPADPTPSAQPDRSAVIKPDRSGDTEPVRTNEATDDPFGKLRTQMVEIQLAGRDITDRRVLQAMGRVPRHRFVPDGQQRAAYADRALPIGHGQTISQPYIVALMTQLAQTRPDGRILDVGTGSGYQAAVLADLVAEVYSIEILCPLADEARTRLAKLGYDNVRVRCGDGYQGWPQHAPFDAIILAAAPDHVPAPLVEQLAPGGRLVLPVGRTSQDLLVVQKLADGTVRTQRIAPVAFVPMTGEALRQGDRDN